AGSQPLRHPFQVRCPGSEFSYRLLIPPRRYGHVVTLIANVDPGGVAIHDLQARICRAQTTSQFSPLATIQGLPLLQPLEGRFLALCHAILSPLWIGPGSARLAITTQALQRGRAWSFARPTRHQTMDRSNRSQTVRRAPGHQANDDHSCRAWP